MFTVDQIIVHIIGDFLLQPIFIASRKTSETPAALIHVVLYTLPFLFLTRSWKALAVIALTHFLVDRYQLAAVLVWLKNGGPWYSTLTEVRHTGFKVDPNIPIWMTGWLTIIADQVIHIVCNALSLKYL